MTDPVLIGVISDTHGLLRPEAIRALQGSTLIVHAGDAGNPEVLQTLQSIAPLTAVRGNVDRGGWADQLPLSAMIEISRARLYIIHNLDELTLNVKKEGFQGIISGHSHVPSIQWRDGILYLNPGSAGPRRFKLPIMVAQIEMVGNKPVPKFIELEV
ncbi:MAG: metallophosphoesterase family protein [Omnitrophica WOR_2 bacterium]